MSILFKRNSLNMLRLCKVFKVCNVRSNIRFSSVFVNFKPNNISETRLCFPIKVYIQKRFTPGRDRLPKIVVEAGQKAISPAVSSNASQIPFNAASNKSTPSLHSLTPKEDDRAIQPSEENNKFPRIDPVTSLSEKFQKASVDANPDDLKNKSRADKDQPEDFLDKIKTNTPFVETEFNEDNTKKSYLDTAAKFGLLDNASSPIQSVPSVKVIINTDSSASNSSESSANLFKECEQQRIIKYTDAPDVRRAGEIKLTDKGRDLYSQVNSEVKTTEVVNVSMPPKIAAGILSVDSKTEVLTAKQSHIVVVCDPQKNVHIGVGFLTSEKDPKNTVLSSAQPISGENKEQLYRPFENPYKIDPKDFQIIPEATAYVEEPQISKAIRVASEAVLKQPVIIYEGTGVTEKHLEKMVELNTRNEAKEASKKKKVLNSLEEESENKKKLKREKYDGAIGAKCKNPLPTNEAKNNSTNA